MPNIWQQVVEVVESNQNCSSPALAVTASILENTDSTCSDNYKTKQPLTTTTRTDPISDPIGAFLNSFGLWYEDAESEQTLNKQIKKKTGPNKPSPKSRTRPRLRRQLLKT